MSISKGHANVLSDDFLDQLGSGDKSDVVLKESLSVIFQLAVELIEDAKENLNAARANASGELSKSIEARDPVAANGIIQIDIEMLFYGQFLNKGVRGTKSGMGAYKFKHDRPSKSMVDAFKQYMKDARSKIGSVKNPYKHEIKNKSVAEAASAYAMARNTLQEGIFPVYFMDEAIEITDAKVSERMGDALEIDILNSLPDNLN